MPTSIPFQTGANYLYLYGAVRWTQPQGRRSGTEAASLSQRFSATEKSFEAQRGTLRSETLTGQLDDSEFETIAADLPGGIVLHAAIDEASEGTDETRAIAFRLAHSDLPVQVIPRKNPSSAHLLDSATQRGTLERLIARRLDLACSVLYQAGAPTDWNLDIYGRYRIGRAAFGTDRIPDGWAERCNALEELWLPSEFHRETFTASGVDARKIRVVCSGVDAEIFRPGHRPLEIPHARSFRFLAITDGHLHSGADAVVKAYVEEFATDENVALLLSESAGSRSGTRLNLQDDLVAFIEIELGRRFEEIPTIILLDGVLSSEGRAQLFASSHAFLNAMRADATGHNCLESLASGVPVIATDWGAACEFLTNRNSFLVEANDVVPADAENELIAGHRWAEPNRDQLRRAMRQAFNNTGEASKRAEQGRRDVLEHFEWSVVFPQWAREFRRLLT
jgi:glycosyltransferase involved in cell wall biosynthesis